MTIENFFNRLFALQSSESIPFLVIGGHAINAYTHCRTTYDLDILIDESRLEALKNDLLTLGLTFQGKTSTFARFHLPLDKNDPYILDVMLVDTSTFEKLHENCITKSVGTFQYSVPCSQHLIALKLHALQNEARRKRNVDLNDIRQLISDCELSLKDPLLSEIIERYAPPEIREQLEKEFGS